MSVTSILTVTRAFPSSPGDREGNFVFHSVEAIAQRGLMAGVACIQPYFPQWLSRALGRPGRSIERHGFNCLESLEKRRYLSIPRHRLKWLSNASLDWNLSAMLGRALRRRKYDLVHIHGEDLAPAAVGAAHKAGVPCLVTLHGIDTAARGLGAPRQRARYRRALQDADRVVLVGEPLRQTFRDVVGRDDHFRVVPNGFSPPPAALLEKSRNGPAASNRLEIISVSNVVEGKGIDVAVEVLARLARSGLDNWRYRVVGDGPQRRDLEARASNLGLGGLVEFLGARPHEEIYPLLATSNLFLLPSYREAFGIAYLEAMAMGLLVIGVKGQGPEAFVRDGESGLLVEPGDGPSIQGTLARIMRSPSQFRSMAEVGRREAWAHWTWDAHAAKLLKVYEEIVR